ncbi:MAG: bifunctional phosphoribosylaminoimidazolecarboxamide formyltransferase/IMP cyclohydrolase [Planctomycetes bacterium]|nr:bifunctional phosphoribosylaminoimidazolecarboxamide formyltransferase/IMP cyclohydrolase [Planctomycetota bacterium]
MSRPKIRRALISVYDKTGIVDFVRALVEEFGIEIISTGGTATLLKENDIPVTLVEEITGFPEMLDGRVKTLHPKIHAAILADRDNPDHMRQLKEQGIKPIDMVVVNLYPFEKTVADPNCTFAQAIEMIDIGGPCLLRAAAKNYKHVALVLQTASYETVLSKLRNYGDECHRRDLHETGAWDAFCSTAHYDSKVAIWIKRNELDGWPDVRFLELRSRGQLRYGENPHQRGEVAEWQGRISTESDLLCTNLESNSETNLSFNNFADGHAALELCKELTRANPELTTCVFIKHTNACGVGVADDPIEAYRKAYLGDPGAAMGGILACNFDINADFAQTVMESYDRFGRQAGAGGFFVEVWIAPMFDDDAMEVIRTAKKWGTRVRLLTVGDMSGEPDQKAREFKSITGGMLVQSRDLVGLNEEQWKSVTKRSPSDAEMNDLRLAWLVCKHTKSNAISICKDGMLIGNGAGQMSRVMSCRIATWLAKENGHADELKGSVAASDAFFPFADGPGILIDAGVTAIIQPGGSKRDEETIAACDARGVAMILTGTRHFKH